MGLVDIKINVEHHDGGIYVYREGNLNDPITDLVQADFDIECSVDGVNQSTAFINSTFAIVEVSKADKPGFYDTIFTPGKYRIWSVSIF